MGCKAVLLLNNYNTGDLSAIVDGHHNYDNSTYAQLAQVGNGIVHTCVSVARANSQGGWDRAGIRISFPDHPIPLNRSHTAENIDY